MYCIVFDIIAWYCISLHCILWYCIATSHFKESMNVYTVVYQISLTKKCERGQTCFLPWAPHMTSRRPSFCLFVLFLSFLDILGQETWKRPGTFSPVGPLILWHRAGRSHRDLIYIHIYLIWFIFILIWLIYDHMYLARHVFTRGPLNLLTLRRPFTSGFDLLQKKWISPQLYAWPHSRFLFSSSSEFSSLVPSFLSTPLSDIDLGFLGLHTSCDTNIWERLIKQRRNRRILSHFFLLLPDNSQSPQSFLTHVCVSRNFLLRVKVETQHALREWSREPLSSI